MNCDGELRLLCETFEKCRVPVSLLGRSESFDSLIDDRVRLLFGDSITLSTEDIFNKIEPKTIYRLNSSYIATYIIMKLPWNSQEKILMIGPYLPVRPDQRQIFELAEKHNVLPQRYRLLEDYFNSIPHIQENSHLFVMLDTFCECVWGGNDFSVVDINENFIVQTEMLSANRQVDVSEAMINMKMMEERYAVENELIRAVSRGQIQKAALIMGTFASIPFEKRLDDPLRNLKNYSIIMNTLLRKAVEGSGVHPIYIDRVSSSFARRIEQLTSTDLGGELMSEMYRSYCHLVRKHTMKNYSSPVRKAILMIDADISANISLRNLAEAQNISAAYLSTIFKRETGKTITEYINNERMTLAAHLLETTNLQIQTIALHCGVLDVQYFSKLFKKYSGKTPKEYREKI
ncbi:MAG: AraC family transcriptional regulator [Ruminococcaceae bacterium]|nr:AraC family transcriptional regulator [Oscillospiraceae bacterium]